MKVLYFARARELAGTKTEDLLDVDGFTVADVLTELGSRFGSEFQMLVSRSTVVLDDEIIRPDDFAKRLLGDEMAILPPVSGGDGPVGDSDEAAGLAFSHHHGDSAGAIRAAVLTASDRASAGQYEDLTGAALRAFLADSLGADVVASAIVPDDQDLIAATVRAWCDGSQDGTNRVDLVVTNGGTGLSPRDVTPQAIRSVLDVEAPGLAELMRSTGLAKTPLAAMSRQVAGRRGATIIVSVPGSVKAATESLEALVDVLPHACAVARESR